MEQIQDWLEDLLELQAIDSRLDRMNEQITSAPKQKKEAQDNLDTQQAAAVAAKEEVRKIELKIKDLAADVEKIEAQRLKVLDQTNSVKDNSTYKALLAEADSLQKQIGAKEEDELILMEELDGVKSIFKEKQALLQEAVSRVEQMMGDLDVRVENCKKQVGIFAEKREEQATKIDSEILNRYTRIKASNGGRKAALLELNGDKCGFCHLKLTAQEINQAQKRVALTACANCGSLIYK
ncbi:MAG: hypothetical protein NE334_20825 [Lentisphaeraceae bacterium]|nr:hypothetical protein [Lentisphaeraceae bacterium]